MVSSDNHIHITTKADAPNGRFERSHADAGRLDGQVRAAGGLQEIQPDAVFRIA